MIDDINSKDLNIDVPSDLRETIEVLHVDEDLNIIAKQKRDDSSIIIPIDLKKLNNREIIDWDKTKKKLDSNLKESGLNSNVIRRISLLISQNYEKIDYLVKTRVDSDNQENNNNVQKNKKEIKIFKYYSEKELRLYESIILGGNPCFLSYENGEFIITEKINENTRALIPFGLEESSARAYEFSNVEEIAKLHQKCKTLSTGDLYKKVKSIVKKYIDQNEPIINIITINIIFSYFQDRFPTTHYLFFIGNNGVGKSVIGEVMEVLSYRGVKMTDPSPANIYRLLGKVQSAQNTLIMDEVERIDNNVEIMNILKTGYSQGGKVPKINTNTLDQEFFNTYSSKIFLSERLPHNYNGRGLLDRTFAISCVMGIPKENIKEVLMTQGNECDQHLKDLRDEIMDLRKEMLVFRLSRAYKEVRPEVDTGLNKRDKELCEGLVLFFGTEVQEEVEITYQHFLDAKYEQKETSFDHFLLSRIVELLDKSKDKRTITVHDLWNSIKDSTNYKENYDGGLSLDDFGFVLHYNQISNKCKVFGAKVKHTNTGNALVFEISSKIRQALKEYESKPKIKCSLVDHSEGSEGSIEGLPKIFNEKDGKTIEPLSTST